MGRLIRIEDFHQKELEVYTRLNENQLYHYHEPENGIFICESPKVIERALNAGYEPISFLAESSMMEGEAGKLIERMDENIPVYTGDFEVLSRMTGYLLTRGALCAMRRKTLADPREMVASMRRIVVLEDVVNPTNLGAIFRSAAALNMEAVLMTPNCTDPLYRRAARVSMGTVFQIPWTYFPKKTGDLTYLDILKELGFRIVAMALREDAISIDDPELHSENKLAILMGTEGEGLRQESIDQADYVVRIPMSHGVDSLNVAAASALAFWELGK